MNTYNQSSSSSSSYASTSTVPNCYISRSKPRKALPRTPTSTKPQSLLLPTYHPTLNGAPCANSTDGLKQSHSSAVGPHRRVLLAQPPNVPQQPPRSSFLSCDPPFPHRRPLQRSLYASDQVTVPGPTSSLSPTSPITHLQSSSETVPPMPPRVPLQAQAPRSGPIHTAPTQFPLISPLKGFFDHTLRCVYSELTHLQSSCLTVLSKERKEKEILRAHYLKMRRERDIAVERARELEVLQGSGKSKDGGGGGGGKRHRNDASEGNSVRIPPPPVTAMQSPGCSQADTRDADSYQLSYAERSTTSPSPAPPPISGRHLYFPPSRVPSPCPAGISTSKLESSSAATTVSYPFESIHAQEPSPDMFSFDDSIRLLSSYDCSPAEDDDELAYPPVKRRRVSAFSESSDHSNVTLVQDPEPPCKAEDDATSSHKSDWGECDMDLEGDSDSESNTPFSEEVLVKQEGDIDDSDNGLLGEPPLTASSTSTVVADESPSLSKADFPPLNLQDLTKIYAQYEGKVFCRLCCSRTSETRWRCDSPLPDMDARCLNLDVLMEHCTSQHPVAYSDVAGLTLNQVFKLKRMLEANKAAEKGAM